MECRKVRGCFLLCENSGSLVVELLKARYEFVHPLLFGEMDLCKAVTVELVHNVIVDDKVVLNAVKAVKGAGLVKLVGAVFLLCIVVYGCAGGNALPVNLYGP